MDLQLSGKVALVTAASKGLGKATALRFGREGPKLPFVPGSNLVDLLLKLKGKQVKQCWLRVQMLLNQKTAIE